MNDLQTSAKKEKLLIIDWLIEHFPHAFFKKNHQIKPLQIGIFHDITTFYDGMENAPPFTKQALKEALGYYSSSPAYLTCQKIDAARVDLYGNEVDTVNADQAKYAYQRYQQRYQKQAREPDKTSDS